MDINVIVDWKRFLILYISSIFGLFMVLLYVVGSSLNFGFPFTVLVMAQSLGALVGNAVLYVGAILLGLYCSKKMGFRVLGKINIKEVIFSMKIGLFLGVILGAISTIAEYSMILNLRSMSTHLTICGMFLSVYGGINEEVIFRLFLMGSFAYLLSELGIKRAVEVSLVTSPILFAIGHTPVSMEFISKKTIMSMLFVSNFIFGLVFGYIYWKKGLEYAMVSHFSLDFVLYVVIPLSVILCH
ncbi:CPBP family intramembrane glutamic endopeptidase [Methanotorris formicicus]|uniref:Abortive infection protein n=1 Tax=Methanotorris formicicus Mc-S-70 TaxID=647171 RepID=H1KXQ4_9EURY|nr:CPBP family intramembrane glutamic endopeptidase [Methanotorris formicicus]EHP87896.1 Abortive infection protein [Methanotorris formicicus Mc-S-70]